MAYMSKKINQLAIHCLVVKTKVHTSWLHRASIIFSTLITNWRTQR